MFYFYDVAIGIAWILEGGLTAFCLYYTLNRKYSMKITMAVSLLIISAVTVIVYALGLNLVFRQLLFSSLQADGILSVFFQFDRFRLNDELHTSFHPVALAGKTLIRF